jgi:beta-glucosidase-like glycosyl hydrolase
LTAEAWGGEDAVKETDMAEIDDLVKRLSAVQERLLALPDGAFAERYQLQREQDELRTIASEFAIDLDADRADDDLVKELRALRVQFAAGHKQRIDLVGQAGSDQQSALGGVSLNAAISEAQGTNALEARIARIRGILKDRGVEISD